MVKDRNETRQLAHKLYGKDKFIKVSDSVRSVDDRTRYARYHYDEAFSCMTGARSPVT